jgi:glucosyl-dolichyl phosphate glucuronosyltransferase
MSTPLSVSVIICTYSADRWGQLCAAVSSVQSQTVQAHEIIVVVDNNPALFDQVATWLPDVRVIENRARTGLSGARNSGLEAARSIIVALLDDDALAAPDWLENLLAGFETEHALGVGGPIIPLWVEGRPRWFPEEFDWVVGCTFRGMPDHSQPVRALIGCNMSFRREVPMIIGGFRDDMGRVGRRPLAGEETEFCIRAHQYWPQSSWIYSPGAQVSHQVPPRRATKSYFVARCYAEGLSKARIARLAGGQDGLVAERAYVTQTLPQALCRELVRAVTRRDIGGLARVSAIVSGLGITVAGYINGRVRDWKLVAIQTEVSEPSPVA